MNTHSNDSFQSVRFALETLTQIIDLDIDIPLSLSEKKCLAHPEIPLLINTVNFLHRKNAEKILTQAKASFSTILQYLKQTYEIDKDSITSTRIDAIRNIMVLVGDAATKLDLFTKVFINTRAESITTTKEFRELYNFYRKNIVPISVSHSNRPLLEKFKPESLFHKPRVLKHPKRELKKHHLIVDLEGIHKDIDYELFFMRKDDGSRFFNPKLIRNLKLVCHFEGKDNKIEDKDIYDSFTTLQNREIQGRVLRILDTIWAEIDNLLKYRRTTHDRSEVIDLFHVISAFILSSQGKLVEYAKPYKNTRDYYLDFINFLRVLIHSSEYRRTCAYLHTSTDSADFAITSLAEKICEQLYTAHPISNFLKDFIHDLVLDGEESALLNYSILPDCKWSSNLLFAYQASMHALKKFEQVPFMELLTRFENETHSQFDPLKLQMFSYHLFSLYLKNRSIAITSQAAPICQENLSFATVTEEFKMYVASQIKSKKKSLYIDCQAASSIKSHARVQALKEYFGSSNIEKWVAYIVLPREGEFYEQLGCYSGDISFEHFKQYFIAYFEKEVEMPSYMKNMIIQSGWLSNLVDAVHSIFYIENKDFSREERLDCIELVYAFFELKLIEVYEPNVCSFVSKDGLDTPISASTTLYYLLKIMNERKVSNQEEEQIFGLLFGPMFITRGRVLIQSKCARLISCIRVLEKTQVEEKYIMNKGRADIALRLEHLFNIDTLSALCSNAYEE